MDRGAAAQSGMRSVARGRFGVLLWTLWRSCVCLLFLCGVGCAAPPPGDGVVSLDGMHRVMHADRPAFRLVDLDDRGWTPTRAPGEWQDRGMTYGNVGWYRLHVDAAALAGEGDVALYLGSVVGAIEVYFNGVPVGAAGAFPPDAHEHHGATPVMRLPRGLVRGDGRDVIAVRVLDTWLGGLVWGPLLLGDPLELAAIQARDIQGQVAVGVVFVSIPLVLALLTLFFGAPREGLASWSLASTLVLLAYWKLYETPFGAELGVHGETGFGFYLGSTWLACAAGALFVRSTFEPVPRRERVLVVAAGIAACAVCTAAPIWALRSGFFQVTEVLGPLGTTVVALRVWRRHRRAAWLVVPPVLLFMIVVVVDSITVSSAVWAEVRRLTQDLAFSVWLVMTAVVALVANARRRRRLAGLPAELAAVSTETRHWVARELHDGVVQELHAVRAELEEGGPVHGASSQLADVVTELRDVAHGLRAADGGSFGGRLERYVARLDRRSAARVKLDLDPSAIDGWSAEHAHHLFRIVQEAVGNALAHADPDIVHVELRTDGAHRVLRVRDDGCGMPDVAERGGMGLDSIRSRAAALCGELAIEASEPGTDIQLRIPWRQM